jgi:hypothetical protein
MNYSLSVVQLCPDAYKDIANAIAEAAGYGPNNLSVKLADSLGNIWWGCHAPWIPDVFIAQTQLPPEAPAEWHEALANIVASAEERSDYFQHWTEVLEANGLSVVQV